MRHFLKKFNMRKIYKITNIALIFMLIGVFLWPNMAYSRSNSLRVPLISNDSRLEDRDKRALTYLAAKKKAEDEKKTGKNLLPIQGVIFHRTWIGAVSLMLNESGGMLENPSFAYSQENAIKMGERFRDDKNGIKDTEDILLAFDVRKLRELKDVEFEQYHGPITGNLHLIAKGKIPLAALTDESKEEVIAKLDRLGKQRPDLTVENGKVVEMMNGLSQAILRNSTLPEESINTAKIIDICKANPKVKVINQLGLDVKVVANREQLIAGLEGIIDSAKQVEINLSQDGNIVKIEISADGKVVGDEVIGVLSYAIKDAGGEIKVDSLTEDEYEKIELPKALRHSFDEEDRQVAKECYPVIEKYMNNLIATIDRVIDELKKPEQLNPVNLRNAYESGVDVELKGSLGDILRKYWKRAHPKDHKDAFGPFDHIVGNIKFTLPMVLYPLIEKLNINKFQKGDEKSALNIFLERRIHSQMALEIFSRAANDKQRIIPGTTFTIYLPIAEGLAIERPQELGAAL